MTVRAGREFLAIPGPTTMPDEVLQANPELGEHLNAISAKLDDATMAKLNASVDVDKVTIEDAAAAFLTSSGLL